MGSVGPIRRSLVGWCMRSYAQLPGYMASLSSRLFGGADNDSWQQCGGGEQESSTLLASIFGADKVWHQAAPLSYAVPFFGEGRWTRLPGAYAGPRSPTTLRNPFLEGSVRFKSRKKIKKAKAKKREVLSKINRMRMFTKKRKEDMTQEEMLEFRIAKGTRKVSLIQQQIKKFPVQEIPPADPDSEILTPEQLHYFKKIGHKNKNYLPVGRRGIYGGTVQNIHLHWKKHETVQVEFAGFSKEAVKVMGDQLARLSGGIVVDIHQGDTVILYRGRNYMQPKNLIPMKTLDKRKALMKSKLEQSMKSTLENIKKLEKELEAMQKENASKPATTEDGKHYSSDDSESSTAIGEVSEFDSASELDGYDMEGLPESWGYTSLSDHDMDILCATDDSDVEMRKK